MTKASMVDREPSMPDGDNVAQDEDENSRRAGDIPCLSPRAEV